MTTFTPVTRRFLPTPSARRATKSYGDLRVLFGFLPTPSARRATFYSIDRTIRCHISTHALREEGDSSQQVGHRLNVDFYPRPPRGGRPSTAIMI